MTTTTTHPTTTMTTTGTTIAGTGIVSTGIAVGAAASPHVAPAGTRPPPPPHGRRDGLARGRRPLPGAGSAGSRGPDPRDQLLTERTLGAYREAVHLGVDEVTVALGSADRPWTGVTPEDLTAAFGHVDLDRPLGDTGAALAEVERLYLRDATYPHHPGYLAHLDGPVAIPAVLGEAVLSAVGSSMDAWDRSAGATLVEQRLVDWAAGRIGFPDTADGVFTSGGTQADLQALLLAREEACARSRRAHAARGRHPRLPELLGDLRILTSPAARPGVVAAAVLLGLGADAVVGVAVDEHRRMRPDDLAAQLERLAAQGLTPMAVVAAAGTADVGGIDPLPAVADLCARHGAWLHVDASRGGGLLVSPTRRHLLDGVERADSVTLDLHQGFFQPVGSGVLVVRDCTTLRRATPGTDPHHHDPEGAGPSVADQGDKSLQTSRRFDALTLWLTLRVMGADGVGRLVDDVADLAQGAWAVLVSDSKLEVVVRPQLSTLVFRYVPAAPLPPEEVDRLNRAVRAGINATGEAVIGGATTAGRAHLVLTLVNPETTLADVERVVDAVHRHAEAHLANAPVVGPADRTR